MKINSRFLSFLIIALVYVVASCVGITTFVFLQLDLWLKLLIADIVATTVVFAFSLIFKNASVYDPYWSVQPIVILVGIAIFSQLDTLKIIVLCAVSLWGVRLTANWAYTFKNMQHQDWRYTMLCEKTKKFYPDRIAGRYCHYCNSGSNASARIEQSQGNSKNNDLSQQHETDQPGVSAVHC